MKDIKGMKKFMEYAISEARKSSSDELPIGAVVVSSISGNVVSKAHNECEAISDPTEHAEIRAIRRALRSLKCKFLYKHAIFSTLEPCLMCYGAILESRVKTVVYAAKSTHNLDMSAILHLIENNSKQRSYTVPTIIGGIREEEANALLSSKFNQIRQK